MAAGACVVFPSNPTVGQTFATDGLQYIWDGVKWITKPSSGGGAIEGPGTVTDVTAGVGLTGGTITTSGVIALGVPVAIANGGTGATNLTDAQTNLGIVPGGGGGVGGGVTSITADAPLTGGTITTTGHIGLTTPLAVANGGTGSTTTGGAQSALGIPVGGLSTPITIAQGGTGATTLAGAQANLGIGAGTGGGTAGGTPWDWTEQYTDPLNYTGRVIQPGYNSGLLLAVGPYPPNYRISDGVTPGGILATGTSNGSLPIRIQPPTTGIGRIKFAIQYKMAIINNNATAGSCTVILGTTSSSGNVSFPLFPYIGVGHDNSAVHPLTILPNTTMQINTGRLDIVDQAFMGSTVIPNWPNWTMQIDTTSGASLLYPAICPIFTNNGTVPLIVTDVFIFGYAIDGGSAAAPAIAGVAGGVNVQPGQVGEVITVFQTTTTPVPVTAKGTGGLTNTPVVTMTLPNGDWDVWGFIAMGPPSNATTPINSLEANYAISRSPTTVGTTAPDGWPIGFQYGPLINGVWNVGPVHYNINVAGPVYLNTAIADQTTTTTGGDVGKVGWGQGALYARRVA